MKNGMMIALAALGSVLCANATTALLKLDAGIELDSPGMELAPHCFNPGWGGYKTKLNCSLDNFPSSGKPVAFTLAENKDDVFEGTVDLLQEGDTVRAKYVFKVLQETEVKQLYVGIKLPIREFAGAKWKIDERSGVFPKEQKGVWITGSSGKELCIESNGKKLSFAFDVPVEMVVQDDRAWKLEEYSIRFVLPGIKFAKGNVAALSFAMREEGEKIAVKRAAPYIIREGKDWIPLKYSKNIEPGSALDFSGMGFCDAPAGKYGWLKNAEGHFEFEKRLGKPQRFYGVNTVFAANFAEHEVADELAERLWRLGYNTVRVHHHDQSLSHGNEHAFERLDYFLAALFKKGIYVTTDCFCSRQVKWTEIGEKRDGIIEMPWYKALVTMHEGAYQDLVSFTRSFLGHVNKYTGRSYAEEPAIPLISLVNENDIAWYWHEYYQEPWFVAAWQKWLAEKRAQDSAFNEIPDKPMRWVDWNDKNRSARELFMADVESRFYSRFSKFLREELHCKALFTDQNCEGPLTLQPIRAKLYDYVDDHFYVDHPEFVNVPWRLPSKCPNKNPIMGEKPLPLCAKAFNHIAGKPLTITEFNFSGPGMYRGVGGILTGAMGALQDWDGIWRFAYSHNSQSLPASVPARIGYFDLAGDPLSQATDRAAICLFLRGDLPKLRDGVAVQLTSAELAQLRGKAFYYGPSWRDAAWNNRISISLDGSPASGVPLSFAEAYGADGKETVIAKLPRKENGNESLTFDRQRGSFAINTPLTCGGFAESGKFRAGCMLVEIEEAPATVWASSLDRKPLPQSSRILVSHVTDVQNDNMVYGEPGRRLLLDWGRSPVLARNGRAEISLEVDRPGECKVWLLDTTGKRIREIASKTNGGTIEFLADVDGGKDGASMLYEIVRQH